MPLLHAPMRRPRSLWGRRLGGFSSICIPPSKLSIKSAVYVVSFSVITVSMLSCRFTLELVPIEAGICILICPANAGNHYSITNYLLPFWWDILRCKYWVIFGCKLTTCRSGVGRVGAIGNEPRGSVCGDAVCPVYGRCQNKRETSGAAVYLGRH